MQMDGGFDPKEKREGGGWVRQAATVLLRERRWRRQIGAQDDCNVDLDWQRHGLASRRGCRRKKKMEGRDRRLAAARLRREGNGRERIGDWAAAGHERKEKRNGDGRRRLLRERRERKGWAYGRKKKAKVIKVANRRGA
ncbi:hypothetical protein Csa_007833 [Cucumis sativus]|nr:hypothetical protein Csa_007833 [Cucumis sativus]